MLRYLELAQKKTKNMEQNVFNIGSSRSSNAAKGRDLTKEKHETSSSSSGSSDSSEEVIQVSCRPRKQDSSDEEEFSRSERRGRSSERSTGRDRGTSGSRARSSSSSRNFPNEAKALLPHEQAWVWVMASACVVLEVSPNELDDTPFVGVAKSLPKTPRILVLMNMFLN